MNDYTRKWLPLTQDKLDKMWPSAVATLTNGVYGWEHMDPTVSAMRHPTHDRLSHTRPPLP
jgi:hypothetical protein